LKELSHSTDLALLEARLWSASGAKIYGSSDALEGLDLRDGWTLAMNLGLTQEVGQFRNMSCIRFKSTASNIQAEAISVTVCRNQPFIVIRVIKFTNIMSKYQKTIVHEKCSIL
jgi:hypothetical protein